MNKLLLVTAAALLSASMVAAQSLTPKAHDVGIGASFSSTANTVQMFYNVTDSIVVEPEIGYYHTNSAVTNIAATTTNYPGTWWEIGAGGYYVLKPFDQVVVQVGPTFRYASKKYQQSPSTNNLQFTYVEADLNVQVLAMLTKNLGVFTNLGGYYYSSDTKNTTLTTDTLNTGVGLQSVSLGVAYFFK